MKLVIMTKSTFFVEEDKILTALFEEGMDNLHISKRDHSPQYVERLLSLIPTEYHRFISIHHNFYLNEKYSLAGIHYDADEMIHEMVNNRGKISKTCTDIMKLKYMKKQYRYIFLKNLNDSIEFPNEKRTISTSALFELKKQGLLGRHIYAMGGIVLDDIPKLKDFGFEGVVICGDLWKHFDIHCDKDFHNVITHFKKLQQAVQ